MGWQDDPVISTPSAPAPSQQQPSVPSKGGMENDAVLNLGTQTQKDADTVKGEEGFFSEPVKAGAISAANAALFNAETHAAALADKLKTGKSYEQAFKERKEYEDALARRNPNATTAGTAIGIGGSLLVPIGPLGRVGTIAADAVKGMGGGKLLQSAASGSALGSMFGAAGAATENPYSPTLGEDVKTGTLTGGAFGAVIGPTAERLLSRFATAPDVFTKDASGASVLTDKALEAVRKAVPTLSHEDIKAIEPQLVSTLSEKGINGPAIKEALMQSLTDNPDLAMPLSKSLVTGTKLPGEAGKVAEEAKSSAAQNAVEIARQMAGPEASKTAGAKAYQMAERSAFENAQKLYDEAKGIQGNFGDRMAPAANVDANIPKQFADKMVQPVSWTNVITENVTNALHSNDRIQGIDLFKYPGLDSAKESLKILDALATNPNPTFNELMYAKKLMNDLQFKATGEDKAATGAVLDGYKKGIQQLLSDGHFSGDADRALHVFNNADAGWNEFQQTFHPDKGASAQRIASLVKQLQDGTPYVAKTLTSAMANAGQDVINTAITEPRVGQHFYETMAKALGPDSQGMKDLNSSIVNNIFRSVTDPSTPANTYQLVKDIQMHLRPETMPITLQAFGAKAGDAASTAQAQQKVSELKRFNAALSIVNEKSKTQSETVNKFWNMIKTPLFSGVGALIGVPAGIGSVGGGLIGYGASSADKALHLRGLINAERAGAERTKGGEFAGRGMQTPIGTINPSLKNAPSTLLSSPDQDQNRNAILPVARARGGRINGPMSANQLLQRMKEVGKKDVNSTKPLLKLHDTTVATALAIANKHI